MLIYDSRIHILFMFVRQNNPRQLQYHSVWMKREIKVGRERERQRQTTCRQRQVDRGRERERERERQRQTTCRQKQVDRERERERERRQYMRENAREKVCPKESRYFCSTNEVGGLRALVLILFLIFIHLALAVALGSSSVTGATEGLFSLIHRARAHAVLTQPSRGSMQNSTAVLSHKSGFYGSAH